MKSVTLLALFSMIGSLLVGCGSSSEPNSSGDGTSATKVGEPGTNPAPGAVPAADAAAPTSDSSGGNIAPMGGMGAGAMTPVQGSENIGGGGSGVGQAAKERAKDIAAQGGGSVSNAASSDDE